VTAKKLISVNKTELPENWNVAKLEEISAVILGQSPSSISYNVNGEGLPFFQGKAEFGAIYPKTVKWCTEPKKISLENDILISVRAPVGPTNLSPEECCIGRGLAALRPNEGVAYKYLLYYLRCIESNIESLGTGTTFKAISGAVLKSLPVSVAPVNEQKLIVAEIEKQFSRLDEAVGNLKRVKANLKRYKASVLKSAVEGKLTEEWRKANPDVEPADKLLERILSDRRKKWEEAEFAKMYAKGLPAPKKGLWFVYVILCDDNSFYIGASNDLKRRWTEHTTGQGAEWTKSHKPIKIIHHEEFSSQKEVYKREKELKTGFGRKWLKREFKAGRLRQAGKVPKDDKWKKKYKEPAKPNLDDLPNLPKEWEWVTWDTILAFDRGAFKRGPFGSSLKKSIFVDSGYKVYEQYCPINDDCSFARYFITDEKYNELRAFAVQAKDFLISCSGVSLGRITQVPDDYDEGVINQALLRVRLNNNIFGDSFFKMLFRSPYFQEQIFKNATGSAIPNVKGVNELKAIPLPLPTVEEQGAIVAIIEGYMSVITVFGICQ